MICDLECRQIIDLLPDREPATVETWLRGRPQIEVVARDRSGGYGGAVARALPQAVQVANRWHLLENVRAAERLQYDSFQRRQQTNEIIRCMAETCVPITRLLVDRFVAMVRNGTAGDMAAWLDEAATSEIASFARGLAADQTSVAAALAEQWSNGQTEGQINRLKTLERQMYGLTKSLARELT